MGKLNFASLVVFAVFGGVVSCAGRESKPFFDSTPVPEQLELISAERHNAVWGRKGIRGGDGSLWMEETRHSSWSASPVALSRLGSFLLNRSWISITEYSLCGDMRSSGRSSSSRQWIDCTFSNGRMLRVFYEDRDDPRILDGWGRNSGEYGYRLDLSVAECRGILDMSEWDNLETWETVDERLPENDVALSLLLIHPGVSFKSKLFHNVEVDPASVLLATRYSSRKEGEEEGSGHEKQIVAQAQADALRRLEDAVQGTRWSILNFTMDGEVHDVERDEEPVERIVCRMSDGQIVEIHVFASDRAWCVIGEGSFRLAISGNDARELLDSSGWKASG